MGEPFVDFDGLLLPQSMVPRRAIRAEVLYDDSEKGLITLPIPADEHYLELPGEPLRFLIPESYTVNLVRGERGIQPNITLGRENIVGVNGSSNGEGPDGLGIFSLIYHFSNVSKDFETEFIVDKIVSVSGPQVGWASDTVRQQIRRLVSDSNCRKAMIDNGFGDPRKLLLQAAENQVAGAQDSFTWTIIAADSLRNDDTAAKYGVDNGTRADLLNRSASATTDIGLGLTVLRRGIFNDSLSIAEIVTHEYFHAIGYPGFYYTQSVPILTTIEGAAGFHDLSYLKGYSAAMKACAK